MNKYIKHLNRLRRDGRLKQYSVITQLCDKFPELDRESASGIVAKWIGGRHEKTVDTK